MHAFATLSVSLCVLALISFGVAAPAFNSYNETHKSIECHKGKRDYKNEYGKTEECYKYNYDPKKDLDHGSSKPAECHKGKRYYKDEFGKVEDCYKYKYDPKEEFLRESPKPIECHKGKRYYKDEFGKVEDCYKYKYDPKEEFLRESPKPIECHKGERYYKSKDGKMKECPKHKADSKKDSLRARADSFLSFNNTVLSNSESSTNGGGIILGNGDGVDISSDIYGDGVGSTNGTSKASERPDNNVSYFRESELGSEHDIFYYNDDADRDKTTTLFTSTKREGITGEPTGASSPEVTPDEGGLTGLLGGLL